MSRIILEPANPYDFADDDDLERLASEIYDATGKPTVVAFRPERGYGGPFFEAIHVWIPWQGIGGGLAVKVIELVVRSQVARWKRDRAEDPDTPPRPRTVTIYDGGGGALKSIEIDATTGDEPEVSEKPVDAIQPRPRPGASE